MIEKSNVMMLPRWFNLFFCFVISFVVVMFYSTSTSFLYTEPSAGDSAIFMTIGKYWAEGFVPYVDLWDSKGPMIFFINAIGFTLAHSKYGVFILQLISLTIAAYYIFKLYKSVFSHSWSLSLTALSIFSMGMIYDGGNTAEEYLLPFLTYSFYCIYRYSESYEQSIFSHPIRWAFVYGFVLSFSLLTRLTNAVGVCVAVAFISLLLISRREWKNLLQNAIAFLLGFLVLLLPFIIYFSKKNALDEMWYGTLFYNIDYAGKSGFSITGFRGLLGFLLRFVDSYFLVLVSLVVLAYNRKHKTSALLWLFVSGFTLFWFLKSNGFGHYVLIALPYSCIGIVLLKSINDECGGPTRKVLMCSCIGFYALMVFAGCIYSSWLFNQLYRTNSNLMECREVLRDLPADYKQSFLAYNCTPDLYIYIDTRPYCRFFAIQDWAVKCSASLLPKVKTTLTEKTPTWFLLRGKPSYVIEDLLVNEYAKYKEAKGYTLYHKR